MTIYLGHRAEDGREQLLLDHLTGVARYAQAFADSFGAGALAYQIGLAHDAGKYSDKFQRRIRGAAVQVDHSTAGAQLMIERRNAPAAYCIAGHHGGLPDGGGQYDQAQPTLSARKEKPVEPYDGFWREVTLEPAAFAPPTILGSGGFTASFWIRMLFSCLVDADYLDTEAFMQGKKPPRGDYASIEELLARLYRYMEDNFKNPKGDLNRERCAILQACMDAGRQQSPGLFTLTVPTGGGKTVSSLAFALEHAKRHHLKRVIYVIPFTSIIDQTVSEFEKILGKGNVLAHHSGVEYEDGEGNDSDQSRKKLAAENWDMPVVVTTAVQFFESLFSNKPSRCRRLHNIAQSVIIFDEAQTIPLPYLKPCVRAIAELTVNYRTSCVLCTATQPALGPLFAEVLPALQSRELCPPLNYDVFRRVQYANLGKLCDEELASRLNGHTQVLCVVGLRKHAQTVFALLEQKGSVHLSTLMTPRHRRIMLRLIRRRLKRGQACRVVSTSLIEAGVDVDFPVVYRAEAGLDSEIQAAGRCNREGSRPLEESFVYLFTPEDAYTAHLPHMLRRPMETARNVVRGCRELDAPETIERYFTQLYQLSGPLLDQKQVVSRFEKAQGSYPFATVAGDFRLIETNTRAVIIPKGAQYRKLEERLRSGERSRELFRKLGVFTVNVYERQFEALAGRGALEFLDEEVAILRDLTLYDGKTGLKIPEDSAEALFV